MKSKFYLHFSIALAFGALAGCATAGGEAGQPVDEDVRHAVDNWLASLQSEKTDAVMASYSDQFSNATYPSKAAVRDAIEQARVLGYLDGVKGDTSDMKVSHPSGRLVVGPVKLTGGFGEHEINLELKDEDGALRIVSAENLADKQPTIL